MHLHYLEAASESSLKAKAEVWIVMPDTSLGILSNCFFSPMQAIKAPYSREDFNKLFISGVNFVRRGGLNEWR